MIKTSVKTYGVRKSNINGKPRYFVMCGNRSTTLNYTRKAFALKKAKEFCKLCYQDFVMDDGTEVKFLFNRV